jgi:hypothetical protein
VGVRGDQSDSAEAAGGQVPEERQPAGTVLGAGDLQAEDLPVPVGVDAGRQQRVELTTRPPSRTLRTRASAATKV